MTPSQCADSALWWGLIRDLRHESARAAGDLAEWLVHLNLEGKAARTLYSYMRYIAFLLRAHPDKELGDFTAADIEAAIVACPKRSRHIVRSVFNKWFEWAEFKDKIERSPMGKVAKIKHPRKQFNDTFTIAEVAQLCALPSPDGHLMTILFHTGIRRAEARMLRRDAIDLNRRRLVVRKGKGNKDRVVALTPEAIEAVADLDLLERLNPDDFLWYSKPGGGQVTSRRWPIGNTTFSRWYTNQLERARVRYLKPHTTRHTYHDLMRKHKVPIEYRQLLMGHEKITTTAEYGHISIDDVIAKLADFRLVDLA